MNATDLLDEAQPHKVTERLIKLLGDVRKRLLEQKLID